MQFSHINWTHCTIWAFQCLEICVGTFFSQNRGMCISLLECRNIPLFLLIRLIARWDKKEAIREPISYMIGRVEVEHSVTSKSFDNDILFWQALGFWVYERRVKLPAAQVTRMGLKNQVKVQRQSPSVILKHKLTANGNLLRIPSLCNKKTQGAPIANLSSHGVRQVRHWNRSCDRVCTEFNNFPLDIIPGTMIWHYWEYVPLEHKGFDIILYVCGEEPNIFPVNQTNIYRWNCQLFNI